jgi:hypothetical protein
MERKRGCCGIYVAFGGLGVDAACVVGVAMWRQQMGVCWSLLVRGSRCVACWMLRTG